MSNLFFKVSGFNSARELPVVLNVDNLIPTPTLEYSAYGHWEFGVDASSLIDKVNGRVLSVQSGATVQPVYNDGNIQLANARGNALISDFVDAANQDVTMLFVAKASSNANHVLGGSLPSPNTGATGFKQLLSYGKVYMSAKPMAANDIGIMTNLTTNQNILQSSNILVAVSVNKLTRQCLLYTQQGGVESSVIGAFTRPYETSVNPLAIGNAYETTTSAETTSFYEAIIFNKALNIDEIKAVVNRAKVRLVARGIAL